MTELKKYQVKYEDNVECGECIDTYNSAEEAEKFIEEQLDNVKDYINSYDYDYADFGNDYGNTTTEIWCKDGDYYARWIRMWEREE